MKKIVFICPYFGRYPNYFNLTLNSIKYNKTIDWLIITDIKEKYDYPENVKIIYMTFEKLREKVQSCFDFSISLDRSYKLCDYKCAYGYIFNELIKDYDFWGYCDFDVIYGNIRKFLSEDILDENNRIYYLGHMSLYKNTNLMNYMFKNGFDKFTDYRYIFSSKEIYAFDEVGLTRILLKEKIKTYNKFVFADIYTWDRPLKNIETKINNSEEHKCEFKINKKVRQIFLFQKGTLNSLSCEKGTISIKEYMYIHLQKRYMSNKVSYIDKFLIVPNKFIDYRKVDVNFILNNSKSCIFYKRYLKTRRSINKRKEKLKNFFFRK